MRSESRRESEVLVLNTVSSDPSCDRVTEMEVDVDSEGDTTSYCLKCGHPEEVFTIRDESAGQLQLQLQQSSSIVNSHPNNNNDRINCSSINSNNLKNRTIKSLRSLSSSSKKSVMSLFVIVIIINVLVLLFPRTALAVDLHPHGGFYHREGGNDFFASSQQHHQSGSTSEFGGGRGGEYDMSDMIMTCSRPIKSSRAAKYLAIKQLDIPCDMADKKSAWCNLPGNKYPWHAVRRFVFENQGLMRRMYGEVRQLSLLRMEFEDDLDDEIEEERQGPPRSPPLPLPEDHRRNSILTEILDESLPRILSETPPGDQLLLRDHHNKNVQERSTPRTLSSSTTTTFFPPQEMMGASTMTSQPHVTATANSMTSGSDDAAASTSTSATTTPVIVSSSEEQMNATEMMMGFTTGMDSIMNDGMNSTTSFTTITMGTGETETASPPPPQSTIVARKDLLEELVTEESIQSTGAAATAADITETDKDANTYGTDDDGETTVTTTEQMITLMSEQEFSEGPLSDLSIQAQESAGFPVMDQQPEQVQQLNDGLFENIGLQASDGAESSLGEPQGPSDGVGPSSDESHDFLNLDKNHILYFEDVGKTRRPVGGGSGAGGGAVGSGSEDQYNTQPQPQQQPQQQQTGKIKAVNACPVKEEVVAPYWANNTRGEILALLNLYPFEQYIHWERCNHENKQMFCRQGCRCEQQYRLHRLLAFDPTNECRGIFSDWFRFPSCCVCRCYLNEYELMMLNAAGQEPNGASAAAKSRTSDRIRSPRKMLLEQLVDGPDVQGVDDMHFFYKQGFYHEHNHGAQPRRKK